MYPVPKMNGKVQSITFNVYINIAFAHDYDHSLDAWHDITIGKT